MFHRKVFMLLCNKWQVFGKKKLLNHNSILENQPIKLIINIAKLKKHNYNCYTNKKNKLYKKIDYASKL
jgi:hypothetical protein